MCDPTEAVVTNLAHVQERINSAARRAGRDPREVTLVAVSKTQPIELIWKAYQVGVHNFGENRVEEGCPKIDSFNERLTGQRDRSKKRPTWHMVGTIQHRKAAAVLSHFDFVHSVDSLRLAERMSRLANPDIPPLPILIECNVSGEDNKFGFPISVWRTDRDIRQWFFDEIRQVIKLPHVRVQGLMTMAPIVSHPEQARPIFSSLRDLRDVLAQEFPQDSWSQLSMGMTDDFEVAIEEGATLVRIGRAIFGNRGSGV